MTTILLILGALQLHLQPWRSELANTSDGMISVCLVLLMLCVSMSSTFSDAGAAIGNFGVVLIACIFVVALLLIIYAVYERYLRRRCFSYFICHHKAHAAGQAQRPP